MRSTHKKKSSTPVNEGIVGFSRSPVLLPVVITLVCLIPFLGRAFAVDEPLFIWAARQIQAHPGNPYAFSVNWYGWDQPMWQVMQNPPLASYYMAAAARIVGWSEVGLHIAFLLPALAAVVGMYMLAKRSCSRPVEAVLAAVLTPVFLTCSTSVMCDVTMLAFWVWAAYLWITGLKENRHWMLGLSGVLMAAGALTKYYGMALIPLLLVYSLLLKRKPGLWLLWFLIPCGVLAAYQSWTHALYGRGLLLDAAAYANVFRTSSQTSSALKVLVGLAFCGGCVATALLYAPLLWSRRALAIGILAAAVSVPAIAALKAVGMCPLEGPDGVRWLLVAQISLFAIGGFCVLALAVQDYLVTRSADSLLLLMWVVGTFAFPSIINWAVNARSLLPMAPAIGILIVRRLDRGAASPWKVRYLYRRFALVLSALVALGVAYADYGFANASRTAAREITEQYTGGGAMRFEGHWGFQYYMMQLGGLPINYKDPRLVDGDLLAIPINNTNVFPLSRAIAWTISEFPTSSGIGTMDAMTGSGFHTDTWGPIPFGFGQTCPDAYQIVQISDPDIPALTADLQRHAPAPGTDSSPGFSTPGD